MPTSPAVVTFAACPVPYAILRDPQVSGSGDNTSGYSESMTVRVGVADLYNFLLWAGGKAYTISLAGGGTATRIIPVSHPVSQGMICQALEWKLFGGYNGSHAALTGLSGFTLNSSTTDALNLVNYQYAAVTLTFKTVPFLTDGSTPFMVVNRQSAGEAYTLAGQKLAFPSDGSLIDADASVAIPTKTFVVTIYQAYSVNDTAIDNAIANPINSASFLGYAAGYLRFDGVDSTTTMTAGFSVSYQISYKFTYRPVPWNQFLRPDGTWEAPKTPGGAFVYGTSDLNALTA